MKTQQRNWVVNLSQKIFLSSKIQKYKDRIAAAQKETGEKDAIIVMKGTLKGMPVVAAAFEFALWAVQWPLLLRAFRACSGASSGR